MSAFAGPHMYSYSHWGMFPAGFYVSASPMQFGGSRAVYVRTDEEGNAIDDYQPLPSRTAVMSSLYRIGGYHEW